ncbi:Mannose-binding protein C [Holothuria leucospilota]|uniref:Mannose-binding protein C n=1 Tax=Holothuria leucospilota TaxID=206669 RepID=A0A9Q0YHD9_HOLLE|nr:Mannose-binding protein C [Holothuria leucospilota]
MTSKCYFFPQVFILGVQTFLGGTTPSLRAWCLFPRIVTFCNVLGNVILVRVRLWRQKSHSPKGDLQPEALNFVDGLRKRGRRDGGDSSESGNGNSVTCPDGFTAYKEKCYAVSSDDTYTWQEAKSYCLSLAQMAFLACPEEKKETNEIKTYFSGYAWLGINDIESEGVWRCNSGSEAIYTRWDNGHPIDNDNQINCVTIKDNGKWHNFDCSETYHAACELDPLATTTKAPTTTEQPTTTLEQTTTQEPTTTLVPTTTAERTTTQVPTTTQEPTTTHDPTTTQRLTTTQERKTTQEPTTPDPTTTQEPTTTTEPATTPKKTTTVLTTLIKMRSTTNGDTTTNPSTPPQESTTAASSTMTTVGKTTLKSTTTRSSIVTTNSMSTTPVDNVTTSTGMNSMSLVNCTSSENQEQINPLESSYRSYLYKRTDAFDTPKIIIQNYGVMSSINCAVNCSNNVNCSAFIFHRLNGYGEAMCELLGESSDPLTTLSLSSDEGLYIKYCF